MRHPTWDDYWKRWSIRLRYGDVQVPALNQAGWYDVFLNGSVENFVRMRKEGGSPAARAGQQLVIGPYIHIPWVRKTGEVDFGPEADNRADERQLRWFDRWLKGAPNGAEKDPAVRVFVMGANTWREADDWPIPGTRFTKYYLHSYGTANSGNGNGSLSTERRGRTSRPTASATTRPTRSRAGAATPAASPSWRRSGPPTRPRSRGGPTSWSTARRRSRRRSRSRGRSA